MVFFFQTLLCQQGFDVGFLMSFYTKSEIPTAFLLLYFLLLLLGTSRYQIIKSNPPPSEAAQNLFFSRISPRFHNEGSIPQRGEQFQTLLLRTACQPFLHEYVQTSRNTYAQTHRWHFEVPAAHE